MINKKAQISIFDKNLIHSTFTKVFLGIGSILGIISLFFNSLMIKYKFIIILFWCIFILIYHICIWYNSNKLTCLNLNINNTKVEILFGDIFDDRVSNNPYSPLKVISFNEYFDTYLDDNDTLLSISSLNGKFIKNILNNQVDNLDIQISNDIHLNKNKLNVNKAKNLGKKQIYKLGSTIKYDNKYLLTAFSKFNSNNEAYIDLQDYINFSMQFWSELNRLYSQRDIELPLIGSGITRFNSNNTDISNQKLLEYLLWTLRISRLQFSNGTTIRIVLYPDLKDSINLYNIKKMYTN